MRLPCRHWQLLVGTASLWIGASSRAPAQELATGAHALEVHASERRLNGRQQPRFTPFRESDHWLFIDSVHRTDRGRELFVSFGTPRGTRARIVTTPEGALTGLTIANLRPRLPSIGLPTDSHRFERAALFEDFDGALALPATKLWDLVPTFHPPRLTPGARWTDSLDWAADSLGGRQRLSGTRVSRLLRDTLVVGRKLWIVIDTTAARYDERALREERTLDTLVTETRSGTGTIHGRMLYDPMLGLALVRDDTLTLTGTAVLRYPEGRSFTTPAHDERIRHAVLYDASGYRARQAAIRADQERHFSGGMVIVATDSLDRRMQKGDTAARDSVLRMWRRAATPNERQQLYGRLSLWNGHDSAFTHRLARMRVSDGDTAFDLDLLARSEYRELHQDGAVDTTRMRQLIDVMSDPGMLFAFGMPRDPFYEDLAQALHTYPPAATRDNGALAVYARRLPDARRAVSICGGATFAPRRSHRALRPRPARVERLTGGACRRKPCPTLGAAHARARRRRYLAGGVQAPDPAA